MSSINNISGLNNTFPLQQTSNTSQRVGGDSDGDSDRSKGAGGIGKSNFMNSIAQALGQSMPSNVGTSTATTSPGSALSSGATQDPQVALQAFLQNLFASLGQANGSQANGSQATGGDSDGDSDSGKSASGVGRHRHGSSNMTTNIQNLLQQLSSSNQSASAGSKDASPNIQSTDTLNNLNSSFQSLMNSLNASQGQSAPTTNAPTLQAFLQNLFQDMGGGQNISGALVSTKA